MRFGATAVDDAEGLILAHAIRQGPVNFRKGRVLSSDDVASLKSIGIRQVVGARLDNSDVHEDEAAKTLAETVTGPNISLSAALTGRVNLHATAAGLLTIDVERVRRFNRMDESITLATLPQHQRVEEGQMVATLKIIPFAASRMDVDLAQATMASQSGPVLSVTTFKRKAIGLIQTRLPGTLPKVLDKTVAVTKARVEALGCRMMKDRRCAHDPSTVRGEIRAMHQAGADLILIAGASAITDRKDVIPDAIERADGEIIHFGMPVDPGNLMLLGQVGTLPIIGMPGCARSPKLNGFDWVLERLVAGIRIGREDVMGMGVGGLLADIPARPLPRAQATRSAGPVGGSEVTGILLAAGSSKRMGKENKLLARVDGRAMVARSADTALASRLSGLVAVTGHDGDRVAAALPTGRISRVHNAEHQEGMGRSLSEGVAALPESCDAVMVLLGDMPGIGKETLDLLIAAHNPLEGRGIIIPTHQGRRGHPILLDRRFFPDMAALAGDRGAREIISQHEEWVAEIPVDDPAILVDFDTPEALAAAGHSLSAKTSE